MTDSMIERVAAALLRHLVGGGDEIWQSLPEKSRDYYRLQARTAIEAMRQPTAEMLDNGCSDFPNAATPYRSDEYLPAAKQIYEAMIDAALEKVPA